MDENIRTTYYEIRRLQKTTLKFQNKNKNRAESKSHTDSQKGGLTTTSRVVSLCNEGWVDPLNGYVRGKNGPN